MEMLDGATNRKPKKIIFVEKIDLKVIENHNTVVTQLTWLSHSTFLLEMDGKKILIDPNVRRNTCTTSISENLK